MDSLGDIDDIGYKRTWQGQEHSPTANIDSFLPPLPGIDPSNSRTIGYQSETKDRDGYQSNSLKVGLGYKSSTQDGDGNQSTSRTTGYQPETKESDGYQSKTRTAGLGFWSNNLDDDDQSKPLSTAPTYKSVTKDNDGFRSNTQDGPENKSNSTSGLASVSSDYPSNTRYHHGDTTPAGLHSNATAKSEITGASNHCDLTERETGNSYGARASPIQIRPEAEPRGYNYGASTSGRGGTPSDHDYHHTSAPANVSSDFRRSSSFLHGPKVSDGFYERNPDQPYYNGRDSYGGGSAAMYDGEETDYSGDLATSSRRHDSRASIDSTKPLAPSTSGRKGVVKLAFEEKAEKESYKGRFSQALGVLHILAGICAIGMQVATTTSFPIKTSKYYTGCWCGPSMLVSGCLGIWAGRSKRKSRIVSFLIAALIASAFSIVLVALSARVAIEISTFVKYYPVMEKPYLVNLGLAVVGAVEFVVCVCSAVICFIPICCQTNQVMAMTEVDMKAAGGEFQRFRGYGADGVYPQPTPGTYSRMMDNYRRGTGTDSVLLESNRGPTPIQE